MENENIIKRNFLKLFSTNKSLRLSKVLEELELPSTYSISDSLKTWKLTDFFDISNDYIVRNDKPTSWDKIKVVLKKVGKITATKGIPIAIGLATGGVGLAATLAPVVGSIIQQFQKKNIQVSENCSEDIVGMIEGKTDLAINSLTKKIQQDNKGLTTTNPSKLDSIIKLTLNEEIQPIMADVQMILNTVQNDHLDLVNIFDGWINEQREQNLQLQLKQDQILAIEDNLIQKLEENRTLLMESTATLVQIDRRMDLIFQKICKTSLSEFSIDELLQVSRIQFQKINLAGKYSQPFNPELFIENPELKQCFLDFITHKQQNSSLFLLLASVGMGKTWNVIHLGNLTRDMQIAVPFFIPIHLGYEDLLGKIFEIQGNGIVDQIGEKCQAIFQKNQCKILFIFDGLDEYPTENRQSFFNFLDQLLHGYKSVVDVILTDRITDWCQNYYVQQFYQKINPFIFQNYDTQIKVQSLKIPTNLSFFLEGFTELQLNGAINKYQLDIQRFPVKLKELCHRPYILRLVYELDQYPDPDNAQEFVPFFYNPEKLQLTILYRLGITGPVQDFFFRVIEFFGYAKAIKTDKDLDRFISNQKDLWNIILCSGIIIETQQGFEKYYHFDTPFQNVLQYYLSLQKGKDYVTIAKKLAPFLEIGKNSEALADLAKYALSIEDHVAILKELCSIASGYSINLFLNYQRLLPGSFNAFNQNPKNFQDLNAILWNTKIDDWKPSITELKGRLIWLRMERKWPWSKSDFEVLIHSIFLVSNDILNGLLGYFQNQIMYDDVGSRWFDQMNRLINQDLPLEVIKLQADRGSLDQRNSFINQVMEQIPPPALDRIHLYGKIFPKEMDSFFANKKNANILSALLSLHSSKHLQKYDLELATAWESLQNKLWNRSTKDLVDLLMNIFSLQKPTAKNLVEYLINDGLKFVDVNNQIVAHSEFERELFLIQKDFTEKSKKVFGDIQKGFQNLGQNAQKGMKDIQEKFKKIGKNS